MARVKGKADENGKVDFTPSGKAVVHGRASSYNNQGCKCPDCKKAWAAYMYPRLKQHRADIKKKEVQSGTRINL